MSIRKLILLAGLCALFAGCTTGGWMGNNLQVATEGDSTTKMGVRYLLGLGVKQNDTKAFDYFNKAAIDGDPFAQNEVAYMYAAGKGTHKDNAKALSWYQQAARHGLASAQYNLGLMYLNGIGTKPNRTLAMEWFKKSAALQFEPARQILAKS